MKNLEDFGVQELDIKEINETDGGVLPIVVFGVAIGWKTIAGAAAAGIFAAGAYVGYQQAANK